MCHLFLPLVSIFGLFPVLVSCHNELICVQLCVCDCVNYPVYISPVFWVWFRLVYSLLPGVSCPCQSCLVLPCPALSCLVLPCPALSCLDVSIKYYYLSLYPRLRVPVPPSCVHHDKRPDLTVSGAHSPRFVFCFWKSFVLFLSGSCLCLSWAWKSPLVIPAIDHCKSAWEFGGIAASPLAASVIPADHGRYLGGFPSSRVAAPLGAPFVGDHATGSPLTQCPPDRL